MKTKEIAILFLIIMSSLLASSKEKPKGSEKEAPKKTWKIVVNNNLSADDNYKLIDNILTKKAIIVKARDNINNTMVISTKNNFKEKIVTYLLTLSVKDNSISVNGKYSTNIFVGPVYDVKSDKSFSVISNRGMKGSVSRETFAKMQAFALLLGSNLEYINN
jgi:hypothetical protein